VRSRKEGDWEGVDELGMRGVGYGNIDVRSERVSIGHQLLSDRLS